jgi:hypothetical protein
MSMRAPACLALLAVVAGGCGAEANNESSGSPTPSPAFRVLASGQRIEILHLQTEANTLSLEYVTQRDIYDRKALQREVEGIWKDFLRSEAEEATAREALILPQEPSSARPGSPVTNRSTAFVYSRQADGTWTKKSGFTVP